MKNVFLVGACLWALVATGCLTQRRPTATIVVQPTTAPTTQPEVGVGLIDIHGKIVRHAMTLYLVTDSGKELELNYDRLMNTPVTVYGVPLIGKDSTTFHVYKVETDE